MPAFLAFTMVLTLLPAFSLPAKAESPVPNYVVTFSDTDSEYVVTPSGGSANEYSAFQSAVNACTADGNSDNQLVIQLDSSAAPLHIPQMAAALPSATYTEGQW